MLFGLVAYAVVAAIALLDPRGERASTLLLIQGVIILINAGSAIWVLQAHQRMAGPAIASLVINLLQIPALLLADPGPRRHLPVRRLHAALLARPGRLLFLVPAAPRHPRLRRRAAAPAGGKLLSEARPLALSLLAVLVVYNGGAILLGFTHSDVEVGLYTTAYKLMFISTVVTAP